MISNRIHSKDGLIHAVTYDRSSYGLSRPGYYRTACTKAESWVNARFVPDGTQVTCLDCLAEDELRVFFDDGVVHMANRGGTLCLKSWDGQRQRRWTRDQVTCLACIGASS